LKKDKFISLLYTFFVILRVFGFCFSVVFIGNVIGIQLAFLNISCLFILFYLFYFNPFEELKDLRLTLAYEIDFYVGVLAATILQIYISAGGDNHSTRSGFGAVIIAADIGMTVLDYISFYLEIQEYVEILYSAIKTAYQKIRNRKRRLVSPAPEEVPEGDSPTRLKNSDLQIDGSPERKFLKLENRDSSPSTAEIVFASSINDPKRPSWKDQTRQSLLREQPLSIVEPKEENINLMSFSDVKSPKHENSKVDDALSPSPADRNHCMKKNVRKSHLSVSSEKEITEIRLNEDGEIAKLV